MVKFAVTRKQKNKIYLAFSLYLAACLDFYHADMTSKVSSQPTFSILLEKLGRSWSSRSVTNVRLSDNTGDRLKGF